MTWRLNIASEKPLLGLTQVLVWCPSWSRGSKTRMLLEPPGGGGIRE